MIRCNALVLLATILFTGFETIAQFTSEEKSQGQESGQQGELTPEVLFKKTTRNEIR